MLASPEGDYRERVSERMLIGISVSMVPDDLQDIKLQQVEHFTDCRVSQSEDLSSPTPT